MLFESPECYEGSHAKAKDQVSKANIYSAQKAESAEMYP